MVECASVHEEGTAGVPSAQLYYEVVTCQKRSDKNDRWIIRVRRTNFVSNNIAVKGSRAHLHEVVFNLGGPSTGGYQ